MRRAAAILIFFFALSFFAGAQPADRVAALRVTFIAKKVAMSPAEAEKLWPIYNEYHDKLLEIRKMLRQAYKGNMESLSESEAEDLLKTEQQYRQRELQLHALYGERMKAVIGARKLVKLHLAEEEFRRELMKTLREQND